MKSLCISIVSHGHESMVKKLIKQLFALNEYIEIILTINLSESFLDFSHNRLKIIRNKSPKGFGENHNAAFHIVNTKYFCVLNPDIEFIDDPFPELIRHMEKYNASLIAPTVYSKNNILEDNIRYFPTVFSLVKKYLKSDYGVYKTSLDDLSCFYSEWVAGMFMLFKADDFKSIGGFDKKFFLYYEDVDICARLWKVNMKIVACPSVKVIHDAQRTSRQNLRYAMWHARSMIRYFIKYTGRLPKIPKITSHA